MLNRPVSAVPGADTGFRRVRPVSPWPLPARAGSEAARREAGMAKVGHGRPGGPPLKTYGKFSLGLAGQSVPSKFLYVFKAALRAAHAADWARGRASLGRSPVHAERPSAGVPGGHHGPPRRTGGWGWDRGGTAADRRGLGDAASCRRLAAGRVPAVERRVRRRAVCSGRPHDQGRWRVASDGRKRPPLSREPPRPSAGRGQAAGRWPARKEAHAAAPVTDSSAALAKSLSRSSPPHSSASRPGSDR
jgi:hypothetical protein